MRVLRMGCGFGWARGAWVKGLGYGDIPSKTTTIVVIINIATTILRVLSSSAPLPFPVLRQ